MAWPSDAIGSCLLLKLALGQWEEMVSVASIEIWYISLFVQSFGISDLSKFDAFRFLWLSELCNTRSRRGIQGSEAITRHDSNGSHLKFQSRSRSILSTEIVKSAI